MGRKRNKKLEKKIARNRIDKLFSMAENCGLNNKLDLADRYVEIARKIGMRYQIKIPKRFKRCYCKHCKSYLLPGVTGRFRVHRGKIVIFCLKCKKFTRIPIK